MQIRLLILSFLCLAGFTTAKAEEFVISIDRNMTCQDESTIGRLLVDGTQIGVTLELPWRNNEYNISRIPAGSYPAKIRSDGALKWRIELDQVRDSSGTIRRNVQIHVGNYARQTQGCILVGDAVTTQGSQCMVTNSRTTLGTLATKMAEYSAQLGRNYSAPVSIRVDVK